MASSQFSPQAQRDLHHVLNSDEKKGAVNVYEFDPAASPQQKAAAAAKGSQALKNISQVKSKAAANGSNARGVLCFFRWVLLRSLLNGMYRGCG